MNKFKIGSRWVGNNEPCFIIAEAGVNHNGDINLAKKLIDVAKDAGADAVKFQTFNANCIVTKGAKKADYQKKATNMDESQYSMIKKLELTKDDFEDLAKYAKERSISILSTPFDEKSADLLYKLGLPAFKISSGDITNYPLLRYIAKKGKPIILSTGMSTLGEVEDALNVIRNEGLKHIILLHCVSSYPAKIESANLTSIETLRQAFKTPVGYSDHTLGIIAPIVAIALGACVLEKHFTLDRSLSGPDHKASIEPDELKNMVKSIKCTEVALGDGIKRPTKEEMMIKQVVRRSIVANRDISIGEIITEGMLDVKRPGTGIEAKYWDNVIGKKAKMNIKTDGILMWDMIE